MELIPVLDLRHGRAVHARRGQRSEYAPVASVLLGRRAGDALALAQAYRLLPGVRHCYVADLDAIMGEPRQEALLRLLASQEGFGTGLWVDAGVASPDGVRQLLDLGVSGVVIGLEALPDIRDLAPIVRAAGAAPVIFSLDLVEGQPLRRDPDAAAESAESLAERAAEAGVQAVLVLDLAAVGSEAGPRHLDLLAALKHRLDCAVYVGGGVRGPLDLAALSAAGCDAVLVGTALHGGRLGPAYTVTGSR